MDVRVFILALMGNGQSWRNAADQAVGGKCCQQHLLIGIFFYLFILYWSVAS